MELTIVAIVGVAAIVATSVGRRLGLPSRLLTISTFKRPLSSGSWISGTLLSDPA
jgi:hypothetical protein